MGLWLWSGEGMKFTPPISASNLKAKQNQYPVYEWLDFMGLCLNVTFAIRPMNTVTIITTQLVCLLIVWGLVYFLHLLFEWHFRSLTLTDLISNYHDLITCYLQVEYHEYFDTRRINWTASRPTCISYFLSIYRALNTWSLQVLELNLTQLKKFRCSLL